MTFYQELQLNQTGSKALIREADSRKKKCRHILIYLFKILLTVSFCFAFVALFTLFFGSANSVAGVFVLLCVLAFRRADLGIHAPHAVVGMILIYGILCVGPHLSNMLVPALSFFVNTAGILLIMILGCFSVAMSNHSTFVLGYLLLQGYDVSGTDYLMRIAGLTAGCFLTVIIYYRNHRGRKYEKKFPDLFREFRISSSRTRWQLRLTLGVSTALLLGTLLHIPRVMWIGIAAMSVLQPARKDLFQRVKFRAPGNILGGCLFLFLSLLLPGDVCSYIGLIGGIGVGLSASYGWQAVFNSFGGIALAVSVFGMPAAILLRILNNAAGSIYALFFDRVFEAAADRLSPPAPSS